MIVLNAVDVHLANVVYRRQRGVRFLSWANLRERHIVYIMRFARLDAEMYLWIE